MSGCKKKRGSFFIEICCEFVKENIGTKFPTFCEGKYLLRSLQSQSNFLSKCSEPKYLHVHLKHFWRSPKVHVAKTNFVSFLLSYLNETRSCTTVQKSDDQAIPLRWAWHQFAFYQQEQHQQHQRISASVTSQVPQLTWKSKVVVGEPD